jgi:hypothetical protein
MERRTESQSDDCMNRIILIGNGFDLAHGLETSYRDFIDNFWENKNDNKYLENIKSFKYFETNNYKRLLSFINSREYEIFIMGHSCGISDRVLLNTLFEHKNCSFINVYCCD